MTVWESFTNQKQWEAYLKNLIRTNNTACLKAILLIYDNQTNEEKAAGISVEDNKVGFSKWDAEEMSAMARKLKKGKQLSQGELLRAKLIMPKYWRQLMVISKIKMEDAKKMEELVNSSVLTKDEIESIIKEEEFRQCLEEGKPCSYGICDECQNTLRNIGSENNE